MKPEVPGGKGNEMADIGFKAPDEPDWQYKDMVLKAALLDEDSNVRVNATRELRKLGGSWITTTLMTYLRSSEKATLRSRAAYALGVVGDPVGHKALTDALRDGDSGVRREAVYAIGRIHAPEALQALRSVVRDESNEVRAAVAITVGILGSLGVIGDGDAVKLLSLMLKGESDDLVAAEVIKSLGEIGDSKAIKLLAEGLASDNHAVWSTCADALARIDDPEVKEALGKALKVAIKKGGDASKIDRLREVSVES